MSSKAEPESERAVEVSAPGLPDFEGERGRAAGAQWLSDRRSVLSEVDVQIQAVLGSAKLTVGRLTALRDGDVVALDEAVGAPIELRVQGHRLGWGELVVVGDQFGVRIQEMAPIDET